MPKFNKELFRGLDSLKAEQTEEPTLKVGAGLLNDKSKNDLKISYLNRDDIEKNEMNKYSIAEINSLAWSLDHTGLIQPLHVKAMENGKYKLLGGERRLTAIDQLIADPENTKWTQDSLIPCVVKDPEEIDLPLSSKNKERFSIITTNKEARNYTDADRMMEIREWKEIIQELRGNGVESIPFASKDGTEDELMIKGEKTRDILVQTTGMSSGTINKFENVEKHASDELKEAILLGKTTINTADEIVKKMDKDEQRDYLKEAEKTGEEITPSGAAEKKAEKIADNPNAVSLERFKKDMKGITKSLKKQYVYLTKDKKMRYDECIEILRTLLNKE